jgi:hypothetical protein
VFTSWCMGICVCSMACVVVTFRSQSLLPECCRLCWPRADGTVGPAIIDRYVLQSRPQHFLPYHSDHLCSCAAHFWRVFGVEAPMAAKSPTRSPIPRVAVYAGWMNCAGTLTHPRCSRIDNAFLIAFVHEWSPPILSHVLALRQLRFTRSSCRTLSACQN